MCTNGMQGVKPDAVVVGKAMGNGFPVSGVIATPKLLQAFEAGPLYFNTFAGGNTACASGLAVLRAIAHDHLQENARAVGEQLLAGLHKLQQQFPEDIGHVRGRGFFIGVELVHSCASQTAAPGKAKWLQEALKREHVRSLQITTCSCSCIVVSHQLLSACEQVRPLAHLHVAWCIALCMPTSASLRQTFCFELHA